MRQMSIITGIALNLLAMPAHSQEIYFNHGFVDVSPATFEAMKASSFVMNEFAAAESKTVVADGGKDGWSGLYLYGERTYLEFFPAGGPQDPLGKFGIGLSIDDRKRLPQLAERMSAATGVPVPLFSRTRSVAGANVDWFDAISPDYPASMNYLHDAWVMGLYPNYLRLKYPDLTAAEDGTSREKVLARQFLPSRLMRNVTAISLTLPEAERQRLATQLEGSGYDVAQIGDAKVATGSEFRFNLSRTSKSEPRSITFHFALQRPAKPQSLQLGESTLVIHPGATATWRFSAEGEVKK